MALTIVTPPAADPVSESEVWAHLRLTLTGSPAEPEDKTLVQAITKASVAHLDGRDGILSRALMEQTWDYSFGRFPDGDTIPLPLAPVQSITSVTYIDENGATQTMSASDYALSADTEWSPAVRLGYNKTWPSTRDTYDAVTVRFVAGYASAAVVPAPLKAAILLLIGHLYENREATAPVQVHEVPLTVKHLISPYRRWSA